MARPMAYIFLQSGTVAGLSGHQKFLAITPRPATKGETMLALFDISYGTFDIFALIAAIEFLVAAYLFGRTNRADNAAWTLTAASLQAVGLAIFSFAFLFLTE